MQVRNENQTGQNAEMKMVPAWAWTLAAVGFAAAQVFFNIFLPAHGNAPPALARLLLGLLAGTVVGCYLLLVGYVSRDAQRRGMSSILWTLVVVFIPNGLGFIVYFILRQPIGRACPQCGSTVQTGFNFCPRCSHKLSASCPQCQRVVSLNDVYCPYCGTSLQNQAASPTEALRSS